MTRLQAINPETATGKTKELLNAVGKKLGITPNMMRTMAASPAVLDAYLSFSGALGSGSVSAKLGEQIALAVAEANQCEYCAAAHNAIGKLVGLSEEVIYNSRLLQTNDSKTNAALSFANTLVEKKGLVNDQDVASVKAAGFSDGEVAEIVAHTALNIFTNYFNNVANTEVDFPKVELLKEVAA
jgi:uncharacterized peroxidase-related enzyme